MADEQENKDAPEPEVAEAPDAAAEAPEPGPEPEAADAPEAAAEAPADDAPASDEEARSEDAAAEAPETEEPAAAAEPPAGDGEPAADEPAASPAEQLPPKERRRRARSTHRGESREPRTAEQRHAERLEERRVKATRRRARRLQERAKRAERRAAAPAPEPLAPVHAPVEGRRKVRQGVVVSDKAAKTITVRIEVARRHRRYEKIVRSSSTVHAHDENNEAHEGDTVRVVESRPLSRTKRWTLDAVLERAR
jgi:small subunit ribosomal protein S17